MICPHCWVSFHDTWIEVIVDKQWNDAWQAECQRCPSCGKIVIRLANGRYNSQFFYRNYSFLVYPDTTGRRPVPQEVPDPIATDYAEACLVLKFSPKASAALSRRCLQHIINEHFGIKRRNLSEEIDVLVSNGQLPSELLSAIDAIRSVGNFAAHPTKSTSTDAIVEVETGEAELLLDVLESLFDYSFVQPTILRGKLDRINEKLTDAGKPPLK